MSKITANDIKPGMIVKSLEGLTGRLTPFIEIGAQVYPIKSDTNIIIVESPRYYQNCGRCVKFTVGDCPQEFYEFWCEFKKYVD